ncbi:hypothetical protein UNDYM_4298 [Undibacterium sp. YM2]|uniref:hypothetical protein n=1 Tax=Undibacterium sp. YM2 TaxID=2058625 RepID=UPI001331C99A|nr:hypothetical protein [Undibacterium sp. YM2]BBB68551.1 hypothetical protein UNDYM_4298 [Undibacterium sp. YM2]
MNDHNQHAKQVLEKAMEAHAAKEYETSLVSYEWFFDHALDEDNASLYGVRLSYCLFGWARLGQEYETARIRLEQKFAHSIEALEQSRNLTYFHDYAAIGASLNQQKTVLEKFVGYHHADPELAAQIVHFIWDELVVSPHIIVCATYMDDALAFYETKLNMHDETLKFLGAMPETGRVVFIKDIQDRFIRDIDNITKVLQAAGRSEEAGAVSAKAKADLEKRNYHHSLSA